jgi:hypothetical protein
MYEKELRAHQRIGALETPTMIITTFIVSIGFVLHVSSHFVSVAREF